MRSMLCVIFLHDVLGSYERVSVDLTDTYDRVDHPVYCDVWLGLRSTALSVCISCAELYGEYCKRAEKSADCGRSMCTPSGFVCLRPEFQTVQPAGSVLIQILNTIFIFAQITAVMIIFTKDAQKMEQKLVRYNAKLQKIASVDALTGLWNRRSMWEYIRAVEYDYEIGNAGFVSIAIADIDFFKRINDTYGHDAGDEVLKAVAGLFMDKMKPYGRVCRWGGEEFLFVFYGRNGDAAYDALQEIYDEIHRLTVSYENEEIRITVTFGLEEYDKNDGMEMAIRRADEKLYQGKETGRDKIVY